METPLSRNRISIPCMFRILLLSVLFSFALKALTQQRKGSVLFWNVENLFDCKDDTLKDDADFLPEGSYHWTPTRYWRKLDNLSRVFAAVADEHKGWPLMAGLAEVENDSVLRDLTRRSPLSIAGYRYVLTSSADARGVDVALLYRPSDFRLLHWHAVRVPSIENGHQPTRDILYVCGVAGDDTLHVLVAHLPSKSRGGRKSMRHRAVVMHSLKEVLDSIGDERILLMGDFNMDAKEKLLSALCPPLHHVTSHVGRGYRKPYGTYVFQGKWSCLDHMFVSDKLWPFVVDGKADVVKYNYMLNEKGYPWRTFRGPVYEGGFSDHLPLVLQIKECE